MPKVNLPVADWESILHILSGSQVPDYIYEPLMKEINKQLDKQEY